MTNENEKSTEIVKADETPDERSFALIQRQAAALAVSSMVPDEYKNNTANCIIAINLANRIGADALMIAQNMQPIKGKPAFSSKFLISCVNSSGKFSPLRFEFQGGPDEKEWGCRARATDKESGELLVGPWVTRTMCKAEGWWSKKSRTGEEISKWQTMPELMFHYRAAAFWSRIYAPELTMGMHTREEIIDIGHATVTGRIDTLDDLTAVLRAKPDADGYVVDEETGEVIPGEGDPRGETEEERLEREAIEGEQGSLIDG